MSDVPEGYRMSGVGVIPEEWEVETLGELTTLLTNGFVGKATDYYTDSDDGVLYIQGFNVEENSFNLFGIKRVTLEFHKQHTKSYLLEGDLLTIQTGDIGLTTIVPKELEGSNCHALIISRFKKGKAIPKFFSHYFNSFYGRKRLKDIETGSTMKHLNVGDMIQWLIPSPPLPEQQAIASALSDVDALITALEQLITKKRNIKQGAMQQLLTGKKRLPGFGGAWEVKKLGDCLTKNPDYGINAPSVPYSDNLPVYIRITDISEDGRFLPEKITSVDNINSNNYFLEKDDLVFARTGASTGKTYLYNPKDGKLVFAGFLIRVKVDSQKLDPRFLKSYTKTMMYWHWVNIMSMRSGQPGINGNDFSQLSIPPHHSPNNKPSPKSSATWTTRQNPLNKSGTNTKPSNGA